MEVCEDYWLRGRNNEKIMKILLFSLLSLSFRTSWKWEYLGMRGRGHVIILLFSSFHFTCVVGDFLPIQFSWVRREFISFFGLMAWHQIYCNMEENHCEPDPCGHKQHLGQQRFREGAPWQHKNNELSNYKLWFLLIFFFMSGNKVNINRFKTCVPSLFVTKHENGPQQWKNN